MARMLTGALGSAPVTAAFRSVLGGRLRVVAYHDVRDVAAFAWHLRYLTDHYVPVDGWKVRAALDGRCLLPRRAVWLTFDDAYPDVVELAMPLLDEAGVRAMLFVCPGVVDTSTPYWWQVVDAAVDRRLHDQISPGTSGAAFRIGLKQVRDERRRDVVRRLSALLAEQGEALERRQVTSEQLRMWVAHGHDLGNHTWDHPLLDHCDPAQQRRQVLDADDWLHQLTGARPTFFAYPNGNPATESDAALRARSYAAPLLFDHRLARLDTTRMSRVRLDAYAPASRVRAVLSGAHPAAFAAVTAAKRG